MMHNAYNVGGMWSGIPSMVVNGNNQKKKLVFFCLLYLLIVILVIYSLKYTGFIKFALS